MSKHFILIQTIWVITILALIWLWAVLPSRTTSFEYNSPRMPIIASGEVFQGDLPLIDGNTLAQMSFLPDFVGEVYGVKTGEEKEVGYCDWDYLKHWWPEKDLWMATKICWEESHGNPTIENDSKFGVEEFSCGLFQVNTLVHDYTCEEMKDPISNILVAIKIYQDPETGGWGNWWNSLQRIKERYNLK